jgi:pimeloyl-ACP methyl ester carboxylesterase
VLAETGAAKVNIVGHSEGGFQSLYVTKTQGIAAKVDKVIAIAPPAHGTTFAGLYNLAYIFGQSERAVVGAALNAFGCPACNDLGEGGSAVATLATGPIAQPGVHQLPDALSKETPVRSESSSIQIRGGAQSRSEPIAVPRRHLCHEADSRSSFSIHISEGRSSWQVRNRSRPARSRSRRAFEPCRKS